MQVPLLVTDFLRRAAALYPDKLAVVDGARRYTYADFQHRVNRLSHALQDSGIRQGDRVCILSPNSHFFLESFYATAQSGIILVPAVPVVGATFLASELVAGLADPDGKPSGAVDLTVQHAPWAASPLKSCSSAASVAAISAS